MVSENGQNEQKSSVVNQGKLREVLELLAHNHTGLILEEIKEATEESQNTIYRYKDLGLIDKVGNKYFINCMKGVQRLRDCDEPDVRDIVIFNNVRPSEATNFAVSGTVDYITNFTLDERENIAFKIERNPMQMLWKLIEQRDARVSLTINKLSTTTSCLTSLAS